MWFDRLIWTEVPVMTEAFTTEEIRYVQLALRRYPPDMGSGWIVVGRACVTGDASGIFPLRADFLSMEGVLVGPELALAFYRKGYAATLEDLVTALASIWTTCWRSQAEYLLELNHSPISVANRLEAVLRERRKLTASLEI